MSTLKVSNINNPSASAGGISIDASGSLSGSLPYPNRNLLYNGAMQVHQRGTTISSLGDGDSGYHTVDRWRFFEGATFVPEYTMSVENDAPSGSGFSKSLKMLVTTAEITPTSNTWSGIQQRLEGQDLQRIAKGTSESKELTLSFWVKSNVTGTYICELYDADNARSICASYSIISSGEWEKKVIYLSADSTGELNNDNESSLDFRFILSAGTNYTSGTLQTSWGTSVNANRAVGQTNLTAETNNYWQVTGVQLEIGPVATDFEFETYATTLQKCKRYYQSYNQLNAFSATPGSSTTYFGTNLAFSPEMRALPTMISYSTSSGNPNVIRQWNGTESPVASFVASSKNLTYVVTSSGVSTSSVLGFNLTADAEL